MDTPNPVHFYSLRQPFGDFSNFSRHPVVLDGKTWPTTEHYFQAAKFLDEDLIEQVRAATSPGDAAKMGRDRSLPLRPDWEAIKEDIMLKALRAKMAQHEGVRNQLLSTLGRPLVEHTVNDAYWGDGGDGRGKNRLGALLEVLREELVAQLTEHAAPFSERRLTVR